MGRGDRRTKRGKIWRGTFGKSRPKTVVSAAPVVEEKKATKAKSTTRKKKAKA